MKYFYILAFLVISGMAFSQVAPDYFAIKFTDKNNNNFSLEQPEEFLTQRSMDRRSNQGIGYDMTDLPITDSYVLQVAELGVEVKRRVKWINTILVKTTNASLIDDVLALPFVESATKIADQNNFPPLKPKNFFEIEENWKEESFQHQQYKSTSELDYGDAYDQIELINGIPLHDMGYQGQGMVIAVLDGGFYGADERIVFDSLWNNGQILGARDFASEENDPFSGSTHGTKVLSTMGANWPGQMVGTAPKADYWLLRTEFTDYENIIEEYNWLVGAAFADSVGADIINSSLGYSTFDNPNMDHSWDDLDGNTAIVTIGADLAARKGILPVNSAGNEGSSSWMYISCPADGDSVFAIGATDYSGNIASFSSRGYPSDSRVKPNICAVGLGTTVADAYFDNISASSGTSFSSPTIAGMTACLWQANPGFTNQDIMNAIQFSASQANNPDNAYGYGIPDYEAANQMVGLKKPEIKEELISVYPNPVDDVLNLLIDESNFEISIFDIKGNLVYKNAQSSQKVAVDNLSNGLYMFRIISDSRSYAGKFLKNKS